MKRFPLLVSAGLLAAAPAARGQTKPILPAGRVHAGVMGGLSFRGLQGNSAALTGSVNSVFTFWGGVHGRYQLKPSFSLRAELLYSRKGFENPRALSPVNPDIRFNYLTLPILLMGSPFKRLSLYAGPQLALLTGARNGNEALDLRRSAFRRLDASAVAGAEFRITPAGWLGARCDFSFVALNPSGTATTASGLPLQLLAAYNPYRQQALQAYLKLDLLH